MTITLVVCTKDRCHSLANTLRSIAASLLPDSTEWEVIVVDNGSRDETRKVVEDFCGRYPGRFHYLYEPGPGKSYALNAGVRNAAGDILAFTDDDVVVEPAWLANITKPLRLDDGLAGVGGRTLPPSSFSLPPWLPHNDAFALAPLAIFDFGPVGRQLAEPPFGNNMAYRKAVFERHGGFRIDLGPRSDARCPQKSEDSEFGARLLTAGEGVWYEPSALLYHSIPETRITRKYFLDWWYDKARSDVRARGIPRGAKWFVAGVPPNLFRRLLVWTLRSLITLDSSRRFSAQLKVRWLLGQIVESHRLSTGPEACNKSGSFQVRRDGHFESRGDARLGEK